MSSAPNGDGGGGRQTVMAVAGRASGPRLPIELTIALLIARGATAASQDGPDTASCRTLPRVMLLGCMKCASTSLHDDLCEHLGLVPGHAPPGSDRGKRHGGVVKEIHFFDGANKDTFDDAAAEAYAAYFPRRCGAAQKRAIDATPAYLAGLSIAERIHTFYTQHEGRTHHLRFLVILREPLQRLLSFYNMVRRRAGGKTHTGRIIEELPPPDAWARAALEQARACAMLIGTAIADFDALNSTSCIGWVTPLRQGLYAPQLARYARHFSARQLAVVSHGGFAREPAAVLCDLADFLGVPPSDDLGCRAHAPRDDGMRQLQRARSAARLLSARSPHQGAQPHGFARRNDPGQKRYFFSERVQVLLRRFYAPHMRHFDELLCEPSMQELTLTPFGGRAPCEIANSTLFFSGG